MPSQRKQINVRADEATEALMLRLIPAISAAIGLTVNQSDLFRLGLLELARKYPVAETPTPPQPPPTRKRGRPRKA